MRSDEKRNHLRDLEETFGNIRRAGICLKSKKSTFGVTEGQFLGFQITQEGIRARREKIGAILNMNPPRKIKEVQKLNGKVVVLSRFLSRSADTCRPFFQLLKK